MAVAWPAVLARLEAALPGVVGSNVRCYDGPVPTGENPPSYLTIGYQPSDPESVGAGAFEQQNGPDGFSVTETGGVLCELAASSGNANIPDVWATFDLIAAWVQSDMTLGGVLYPGSVTTVGAEVVAAQTTSGAVQRLRITFTYIARL